MELDVDDPVDDTVDDTVDGAGAAGRHADAVGELERWFERRGLPHFVETDDTATTIWGRAVWLLLAAALVRGFGALDLAAWTPGENVAAAATIVVLMTGTWMVSNRVRGRAWFAVPRSIGGVELALFLFIPALPAAVFGQWRDAAEAIAFGVVVLAAIYLVTSYGVIPLLGWAGGRAVAQLPAFAGLVVRALPLLLLFTTFLFINAEVWEVAGNLHGLAYGLVLAVFFGLGSVFVLSRIPALMRGLARFDDWSEIEPLVAATPAAALDHPTTGPHPADPLRVRQRLNIGLVTVFNQAIQITLVAIALTGFFVLFGVLAIPTVTTTNWTGIADVHVFATLTLGDRQLVLTEPLLRVAGFLGAFSGMYFTVVLSTDATYRDEFAEDVAPQVREALAARAVYRHHRAATRAAGHDGHSGTDEGTTS